MRKHAATLMDEDTFWDIIERSGKGKNLAAELAPLTPEQLIGYVYRWNRCHDKLYTSKLWAVGYCLFNGCSDDSFHYFRSWVLSRGREVYQKTLADPDSLSEELLYLPKGEYPKWEVLAYVPLDIFEEKSGMNYYVAAEKYEFMDADGGAPDFEFTWDSEDPKSIRHECPKTFDAFYGKCAFSRDY